MRPFFPLWQSEVPGPARIFFGREKILGFLFIGVLSSGIDIGLLWYLTEFLGIWYLVSAAISHCCGTLVSYGLNKHLTFHDGSRDYLVQFVTFAAISVSCLMMNLGIIWLLVEVFAFGYLPAKILATLFAFLWNYHGQNTITFRAGRGH